MKVLLETLRNIPEPYASMVFVAIYTGLRASELIGLRWRNVHENALTVEERCCRGDWGVPKSEASAATIAVNRCVIERIHLLKLLTVKVRAGRATRKYKVVKSDGPNDLNQMYEVDFKGFSYGFRPGRSPHQALDALA